MSDDPGILLISLDLELYWGVRDVRTLENYRAHLEGVGAAVRGLLDLFARYAIRATWAAVGFLHFDSRDDLLRHLPARRPNYRDCGLDPYMYAAGLPPSGGADTFHFAPDLVGLIAAAPHQELASHTFSHYYCLEPGQAEGMFEDDLRAAVGAAARFGTRPESLVFPRNQVNPAYLAACARQGFTSYRGNERSWIYPPNLPGATSCVVRAARLLDAYLNLSGHHTYRAAEMAPDAPLEFPSSRFLRPYSRPLAWLEPLRLRRIRAGLTHAAEHGRVYHLWWHPENFGVNTARNLAFLGRVLDHFDGLRRRFGMESLTMRELAARRLRSISDG